jgi:hypothetical protein
MAYDRCTSDERTVNHSLSGEAEAMSSQQYALDPTDSQLFDQLAQALRQPSQPTYVESRRVAGWPFAWILHPGLADGLTVACTASLSRRVDAGFIAVHGQQSPEGAETIALTELGMSIVEQTELGVGMCPVSLQSDDFTEFGHELSGGLS